MAASTHSLHTRFVWIVLRVAIASTVVAALAIYQLAVVNRRSESAEAVRGVVSAIERTLAIGLYAKDKVLLQELADGLARHPLVRTVSVEDVAEAELVHGRSALPGAASAGAPAFETNLVSPFDPAEKVGRLRVWINQQAIAQKARQQALVLIVAVALAMTGVVLAFNAVALRALSRPMHRLSDELTAMKPGGGGRLTLQSDHVDDEIGVVIQSANQLLEAQQRAIEQERGLRQEIARMEAQYRQIFDTTSAGIFVLGPGGRLINSNRAVARVIGADDDAMQRLRETDFADTVFCDRERWEATVAEARRSASTTSADLELRRLDGSHRWVHCLISVQEGVAPEQPAIVEGVLYDVTQRRDAETRAARQAEIDALTGLANRRGIERLLEQKVDEARAAGGSVTLMFIDLDGFKAVNDTFGHDAGDAVLIECARRLRGALRRKSDIVGRLGGDELVLVLEHADPTDPAVLEVARQVVQGMAQPILVGAGRTAQVGASVGVAGYPRHGSDGAGLMRAADAAMYAVKRAGKCDFRVAEGAVAAAPADQARVANITA
ncbi:MAG: sensor domain-containing diguanylate cyclase [Burkholderiales bacterium]|nr:sensor domain-containing diguanylate cyclase [Burkholderiales bacterium]